MLVTFLQVHSKEVSYLLWQNKYPNLNAAYQVKRKLFLWTKHTLNTLPLAKYFVYVAAALSKHFRKCSDGINREDKLQVTKLTDRYFSFKNSFKNAFWIIDRITITLLARIQRKKTMQKWNEFQEIKFHRKHQWSHRSVKSTKLIW